MLWAELLLSHVMNLMYSVFALHSCFSLGTCWRIWIWSSTQTSVLFSLSSLHSLSHSLSPLHTHTHNSSISQPTPGTDKASFMFPGLSWGQWGLVLRASFTRSEQSWKRNEKKPYISRCCRVKEVLLVYNSFPNAFQHHRRDAATALYRAHLLLIFSTRRWIIVYFVPSELSVLSKTYKTLCFCHAAFSFLLEAFMGECVLRAESSPGVLTSTILTSVLQAPAWQ